MVADYTVDSVLAQFKSFLDHNPYSRVEMQTWLEGKPGLYIVDPWSDRTLAIHIPENDDEREKLAASINGVNLPKRFSAILHVETGLLEVIWTAFKLAGNSLDVVDRSFVFEYEGRERQCRFDRSSETLVALSSAIHFRSNPSNTEHRNLFSFHLLKGGEDDEVLDIPRSFFVDCAGLDEAGQIEMATQLNAYMRYFDRKTPRVLIHEITEAEADNGGRRYVSGAFPKVITAHPLDQNLVSFWIEMTATNSPFMRLLLGYRIIEYAAFNFVEANMRSKIRRLIAAPDVKTDIDGIASKVAEIIGMGKELDKIPRTGSLVNASVDLHRLWDEIQKRKSFFSTPLELDGGFIVKALIAEKDTFETYATNGARNTLDRLSPAYSPSPAPLSALGGFAAGDVLYLGL
jgi:hypothetical protein